MSRTVYLLGGLYLLAVAWLGPLPQLAETSFAAHMGLHLILIAGAAPLIALGLSGTQIDARLAAVGLLNPILASVAELVVVWAWHAPGLHDASRGSTEVFVLEQTSFLAVGLLLWLSAVGSAGGGERRAAIGVIGMLLTSMHMALLGALLNLAPRPLYHHQDDAALTDQQLGGLLMLVVGGTVYLLAGLWLLAGLLRTPAGETREHPRYLDKPQPR
jgi:putative membrane protein